MVAGGPYGLEDIIGQAGYLKALVLLAVVPLVWSLPTSLMVGELASAIPAEGGYYVWVERALGRFWGFQEAWLSLAASVFDMAIYPTIFVLYLGRIAPAWTAGYRGTLWALAIVVACATWNLTGARAVGEGSVLLFCILLAPFVVMIAIALTHWHGRGTGAMLQPVSAPNLSLAIAVTMWNYMGWDNASTIAQEVEDPQSNYPRAMLAAAALVALTYILPLAAVALFGIAPDRFAAGSASGTGSWTDAARMIAGPALGLAIVLGGMINGTGMFNALMMSYSRVPYAFADERLRHADATTVKHSRLLRLLTRLNRHGVPWASLLFCAAIWALALRFSFERLISIDLVLYGAALLLEFVALIALRVREPQLQRPFRIPGGVVGAVLLTIGPTALIGYAIWGARDEQVLGMNALLFSLAIALAGALLYAAASAVAHLLRRRAAPLRPS
jgi:amino acid transporter